MSLHVTLGEFPLVVADEFPGGVVCMRCQRPLEDGQPYASVLHSMAGKDAVTELVCVYCVDAR